jgi:hypothetical protein
MRAVLVPGTDYGTIPGMGDKPSLFKPGAEKLIQWFGFGFSNDEVKTERDDPEYPSGIADKARRIGVTYRCTVYKELADGRKVTVATCEAYAGYDEDKFFISLEAARAKAEAKERQYAVKDKRQPNSAKWEYAAEYRAPWNSVIKMCEKRSLVGAAIDATAAAGLFTQDLEDMRGTAVPDAGGLAEAAMGAVMALADDVRDGLDKWYRGKRWPDPSQWTAEQWCAALQMAGYLNAQREHPPTPPQRGQDRPETARAQEPAPAARPEPAADPLPDAGDIDPEAEFVRKFVARTATAGETEVRSMRVQIGKAVAAKVISPEVGNDLGRGLTERMNQLRNEVAA